MKTRISDGNSKVGRIPNISLTPGRTCRVWRSAQIPGVFFRGNTYPFKDTAKQMGFRWMEEPVSGALGILSMKAPRKAWVYTCKEDGLSAILEKISSAGLEIKSSISGLDLMYMGYCKKQDQNGGDA